MGVYHSDSVQCDFKNSLESAIAELIKDNEKKKKIKPVEVEPNCSEDIELLMGRIPHSSILDPASPQHEAAVKLQKVYKSFRTRRKLADCAVLIEHSWWKLLDFAELKHSSISFFDIDRHETAISRWSRARTRAAKVGKGLSKNGKAQKLALQHWLEAIDPRHRYGHNLHFYYVKWLNSQSKEPFFYWLDIGEGKDINLVEKCPRLKLQQQCIKYLGPMERKAYEVVIEGGKLVYKQTGQLVNTTKGSKWIFVLSTSKTLYVGKKKKGTFQHSSFLAGGATLAAGRVVAENGALKAVWPHSGHYKPTPENFQDFVSFLRENDVDLNDVKLDSTDDEEEESMYLKSNASRDDSAEENESDSTSDSIPSVEETTGLPIEKLSTEIDETTEQHYANPTATKAEEVYEMKEDNFLKQSISQRIKLHKEAKSFQLGKQLCCKWSSGAGPRIGCLRDYPLQLQRDALRRVNLSPRSKLDSPSQAESSCNLSCRGSLHSTCLYILSLTPYASRIVK